MDILERINDIPILAKVNFRIINDNIEFVSISDKPIMKKLWIWEKSSGKDCIISITMLVALKCWLENRKLDTIAKCSYPIEFLKICVICRNDYFSTILCQSTYPDNIALSVLEKNINIEEAQKPEDVDNIYQIQKKIDNISVTLHNNLEKILLREQKLEDLQEKNNIISKSSMQFYKKSKSMNRCCIIL